MLHHLAYASHAVSVPNDADLLAILQVSRERNEKVAVTGMLLYQDGSFVQVLEGDRADVWATFDRIRADTRHERVNLLFDEPTSARDFATWSMGFLASGAIICPPGLSDFLQHTDEPDPRFGSAIGHEVLRAFRAARRVAT